MAEYQDGWRVLGDDRPDRLFVSIVHGFLRTGTSNIATFVTGYDRKEVPRVSVYTSRLDALTKAREMATVMLAEIDKQIQEEKHG